MRNLIKLKYLLYNNVWLTVLFLHTYLVFLINKKDGFITLKEGCFELYLLFKILFFIFFITNLFTYIYVCVKTNKEMKDINENVKQMAGGFFIFALFIIGLFLIYSIIHIYFHYESFNILKTTQVMMIALYIPVVMVRVFFSNI
jgi:hypothetical protein